MNSKNYNQTTLLCILDGWGKTTGNKNDAIFNAKTPFFDSLMANYPNNKLQTSGLAVGLPDGQMGNSEVGHMNIGSGRVAMQNLPLIDSAILDKSLENNIIIQDAITKLKLSQKSIHLIGMISDGGVHSHINHIIEVSKIFSKHNIKVKIHAITDGRDTPPLSASKYIEHLTQEISNYSNISICSLSGRYFAMDRDNRFERIEKSYNAIMFGEAPSFNNSIDAINSSFAENITDEFIEPVKIGDYHGVDDGDAVFMVNFRSDRVRQILSALVDKDFKEFERKKHINFSTAIGMVEYSGNLNQYLQTIFTSQKPEKTLGEVIADNNLNQLRIAETEKYAHVTFFFNGGREENYKNEERILVPSPDVATYDLKPEMSAFEVTTKLKDAINSDKFSLIVVNFANTDMVGHTGNFEAAKKAVEEIDSCLKDICSTIKEKDALMLITADHGNAEQMTDEKGNPHTSHTTGPVPIILFGKDLGDIKLKSGKLSDIAPTILELMNIDKPKQMTGESLIV